MSSIVFDFQVKDHFVHFVCLKWRTVNLFHKCKSYLRSFQIVFIFYIFSEVEKEVKNSLKHTFFSIRKAKFYKSHKKEVVRKKHGHGFQSEAFMHILYLT